MLLIPLTRALSQLTDPVFFGVVWRSVLLSALCFAALIAGAIWSVHHLFALGGPLAWLIDALGSIAAGVLALWLFLPLAAVIGTFYSERIAVAVERRYYPSLPPPGPAPLLAQLGDGIGVGLRLLGLNIVALLLTLFIPGIGLLLGWAIASWAFGRGLFGAVALRRLTPPEVRAAYRALWPAVLAQGGVLAAAAYVPMLNLLIPVLGVAAMVHVLDMALLERRVRDGGAIA